MATSVFLPGHVSLHPFLVTNHLHVAPNSTRWVTSHTPLAAKFHVMEGVVCNRTFKGSFPIKIRSPCAVDLYPDGPWSPQFAAGWEKLPDELKLRVLGFNLTFKEPINGKSRKGWDTFLHFMTMTPDIANLSQEVFCKTNTFQIYCRDGNDNSLRSKRPDILALYPKLSVNSIIRRVQLHMNIDSSDVEALRKFTRGDYGIGNLEWITIIVDMKPRECPWYLIGLSGREWVEEVLKEVIHISCAGEVRLEPALGPRLEAALKSKISFSKSS
ncbi:hypothetical protein BDV95DRAFT_603105 [Massariosphaeria phaeospora]|uniref:Uncharacterized protein n=1 Tax=Massariosphaeria phaeospora TaxID=100035 RepID=A0A7C8MDN1_9PLEO|nr:hypothetical protein BDV95DRAFT_603105 [Massariosphaeria phaeospora]